VARVLVVDDEEAMRFALSEIMEENGIQVPTTWSELISACEKLKSAGVVPLGIGGKDSAGLNMLGVVQTLRYRRRGLAHLARVHPGSVEQMQAGHPFVHPGIGTEGV